MKKYLTTKNIAVSILIAVVVVIVIVSILAKQKEQAPSAEAPLAKICVPTPGYGKQTYNILTDKPKDLQIMQIDVDPIDVQEGGTQTITVKVKDKNKNADTTKSSVSASIITDNKNTAAAAFVLRLVEESKDDSSLLATWEGLWTRDNDTVCHTYSETIIAKNGNGDESKIVLSFK